MRAEDIFGLPMAAPETPAMRRLRFAFIAVALATGLAILLIDLLTARLGRVATGGLLFALVIVSAALGCAFFVIKTRRDDRWISDRGFDTEGEGA